MYLPYLCYLNWGMFLILWLSQLFLLLRPLWGSESAGFFKFRAQNQKSKHFQRAKKKGCFSWEHNIFLLFKLPSTQLRSYPVIGGNTLRWIHKFTEEGKGTQDHSRLWSPTLGLIQNWFCFPRRWVSSAWIYRLHK